MPHYDYRCRACQHQFEIFQSIREQPRRKCPQCGKLRLERLIGGGGGLLFRGSGFYVTDYRDTGSKGNESDKAAGGGPAKAEPSSGKKDSAGETSGDANKSGASPGGDSSVPAAPRS